MSGEISETLQPYLNPEYWNGHSIGFGQPSQAWPKRPVAGRELRQSKKAFQDRIALMEKALPIETFNECQTFDADAYEPGTLVIFREESLHGNADKLDVDVETLRGQPLPTRPLNVSPSFGRTSTTESIRVGEFSYFTAAIWGIVAVDKARRTVLHTFSTGLVDKLGGGRIIVALPSLGTHQTPINIGETNHFKGRYGSEWLQRTNILDVVAYGQAEKKRVNLRNLAAKLAFGNSSL